MDKSTRQTFTCVGINNTISILKSKRFHIEKILILRNSKAEKHKMLNIALQSVSLNIIKKVNDIKQSASFKTQGISITFSGRLIYNEIQDW